MDWRLKLLMWRGGVKWKIGYAMGFLASKIQLYVSIMVHGRAETVYRMELLSEKRRLAKEAELNRPTDVFNLMLARVEDMANFHRKDSRCWNIAKAFKAIRQGNASESDVNLYTTLLVSNDVQVYYEALLKTGDLEERHLEFYGEYVPAKPVLWEYQAQLINGKLKLIDPYGEIQ